MGARRESDSSSVLGDHGESVRRLVDRRIVRQGTTATVTGPVPYIHGSPAVTFPSGSRPVVSGTGDEQVVGVVQGEDVSLTVDLPVELEERDEEMGDVDNSPLPTQAASNAATSVGQSGDDPHCGTRVDVVRAELARNQVSAAGFESARPFHKSRSTLWERLFSAFRAHPSGDTFHN